MPSRMVLFASAAAVLLAGSLTACKEEPDQKKATPTKAGDGKKADAVIPEVSAAQVLERAKPLFGPLPEAATTEANPLTDAKIELGRMIYYETRLSKTQKISCNNCHDLEKFGIDVREKEGKRAPTSLGHEDQPGARNSPTVYNAAIQVAQFWDGREATVEDQAKGPILNPIEMAMPDETFVLKVLKSIPGYVERFKAAFPEDSEPITYDNMAKAVGAFERKLITPAPFDEFMQGKMGALDKEQLYGLQLFMDVGCTTCHTGPGVGGTMFQKLGSVKPYESKDLGRYELTKQEVDKYVFKVPILRNVTQTAPYMHDGSIETLEEMTRIMVEHQTARGKLTDVEMKALLAFMRSLEGKIPLDYIAKPELPESGPDTPGPG